MGEGGNEGWEEDFDYDLWEGGLVNFNPSQIPILLHLPQVIQSFSHPFLTQVCPGGIFLLIAPKMFPGVSGHLITCDAPDFLEFGRKLLVVAQNGQRATG